MIEQRKFKHMETQWSLHMRLECNIYKKNPYVSQDTPARQHLHSYHVSKRRLNDISDLIIISEKTKTRFFRYCLEMIKRNQ